jgi:hypothetical protein
MYKFDFTSAYPMHAATSVSVIFVCGSYRSNDYVLEKLSFA